MKRGVPLKYRTRLITLTMALLLLVCGFGCKQPKTAETESALWHLSERYPVTYGTLRHAYVYEKDGQIFYLSVARAKAATARNTATTIETKESGERTYTLCKHELMGTDSASQYTFYACQTETLRFILGNEEADLAIDSVLTMDEAIALIEHPLSPKGDVSLQKEEWSAYYRLDACNLEISVFPNDDGKQYRLAESEAEQRTEDGETYLFNASENLILYSNGTDTVSIRQINRSGKDHVAYNTVSECKALIAMLGSH